MKKITKLFIQFARRTRKPDLKISAIKQKFEIELKAAKNKGDKIAELALQRAYYAYLSENRP